MERTEASETPNSAMRRMRRHFEVDSPKASPDSPRNFDFTTNKHPYLYSEPDDYPISRSILQDQVTAEGLIIGFRTKKSMTAEIPVHPDVTHHAPLDSPAQDQSLMAVMVPHHCLRSVALSIAHVIRPEYVIVDFAEKNHLGLFKDGALVCSTRSPGGKALSVAGLFEQRGDFLLRAPRDVFKRECMEVPFAEPPKRRRNTKLKEE